MGTVHPFIASSRIQRGSIVSHPAYSHAIFLGDLPRWHASILGLSKPPIIQTVFRKDCTLLPGEKLKNADTYEHLQHLIGYPCTPKECSVNRGVVSEVVWNRNGWFEICIAFECGGFSENFQLDEVTFGEIPQGIA